MLVSCSRIVRRSVPGASGEGSASCSQPSSVTFQRRMWGVAARADQDDGLRRRLHGVDDDVLHGEHILRRILQRVQTRARADVPDNDALVGPAADEDVFAAYSSADDGLHEICVADVLAAWRSRVDVPGPDGPVPAAGKECLVLRSADRHARYRGRRAPEDGLHVSSLETNEV